MRFRDAHEHHLPPEEQQCSHRGRWRRRVKKALGSVASIAVVASSLIVAGVVTAEPAAAADPFACTPGAVFVQSSSQVRQFTVTADGGTLGTTNLGANHSDNGLGISSGGRFAYTVTNGAGSKTLAKHDRATDQTTRTNFTLNSSVLRGAVNPTTGVYYFASGTVNNAINLYAWNEKATPQSFIQVGTLRPTSGSSAFGANGDMAFSASGQLVIVADRYVYAADIPLEIVQSTSTIGAKQVHDMGSGVNGNGIAFGNYGHIFVSDSVSGVGRIIEVDLARGEEINRTTLSGFAPTDMSSCTFPNTLTLKKDLPDGRHAATDQFSLSIDSPVDYEIARTVATTLGNAPGVQPDYAGPIFVNQGDVFTLSESAAGTTDLDRYAASLRCEQDGESGATPVAVNGNRVTIPAASLGTDIVCAYVNAKLDPELQLRKRATPVSGTPVTAGQTITYTVEAENTGNTALNPVEIVDDISNVVANATYQGDVTTEIDGTEVPSGAATVTGQELAWTGVLEPGQVVTITYSVIVNDDAAGETITNRVTASGTPPNSVSPVVPPAVTTEHPVAGFEVSKTADSAPGTPVEPGQNLTYTVTGTNTGATALSAVSIVDDLSEVVEHASYNGDVVTEIDGATVSSGGASITAGKLSWNGTLRAGQTVTITYSVTVNADASGEIVRNAVTGRATPTTPNPADPSGPEIPGEPITPPVVTTEHPVIGSGFTISKTANPASGTAVEAGDTITYTVVGTNTGETTLDPATISDDLSAVLANAGYNADVTADRGSVVLGGDTLTWTGSIPKGRSVTITYSVTVDEDVSKALLRNVAMGEATPQIPVDKNDPESPTIPGTPIVPPSAVTAHPVVDNGFEITKTADPATGTAVEPGDTITYTVTGSNTGTTILERASITDDLSAVLNSAEYNGDLNATVGSVQLVENTLSWTGTLSPDAEVVITYSVTVNDDVTGALLRNTVSGEAIPLIPVDPTDPESPTEPGDPIAPPTTKTEHPVVNPGFEITKTANPASGTTIDPGSVVEYTVTGTNTGDTTLNPVSISDNLAGVLAHASYDGNVKASLGTATLSGATLTWTGVLEPQDVVVITYSVTITPGAGGQTIRNTVSGSATPLLPTDLRSSQQSTTPGAPIVPPTVTTAHPVASPGFTFTKSVDPASGTGVDPGQVLTYTLIGTNTGETALDPVEIVDNLVGVLDFAEYNGDGVARVAGAAATAPALSGDVLTWNGSLAAGQSVVITYSVTVNSTAAGQVLVNSASATATPPGGGEITPPGVTTSTPVNRPGFSVSKSAAPVSGTAVDPGSVITYTVTGSTLR